MPSALSRRRRAVGGGPPTFSSPPTVQEEWAAFNYYTNWPVPTYDYQIGVQSGGSTSKTLLTTNIAGCTLVGNEYRFATDGVTIDGYDLRGSTYDVRADNVTFRNCRFGEVSAAYMINQQVSPAKTGLVIENCEFTNPDHLTITRFVASTGTGTLTVRNCSFLDAFADSIDMNNGTVEYNYFALAGWSQSAHTDIINLANTNGDTTIRYNYMDARRVQNSGIVATSCIAFGQGTSSGTTHTVTVEQNIMLGAQYSMYINDPNSKFNTFVIDHNFMGELEQGIGRGTDNNNTQFFFASSPNDPITVGTVSITNTNIDPVTLSEITYVAPTIQKWVENIAGTNVGTAAANDVTPLGDGNDTVTGGANANVTIVGGEGADTITVSTVGPTTLRYDTWRDSTVYRRDSITGFTSGRDKIDLSALLDTDRYGPITLQWEGHGENDSTTGFINFSGTAGSIYAYGYGTGYGVGSGLNIEIDLKGNRNTHMRIALNQSKLVGLTKDDFIGVIDSPIRAAPAVMVAAAGM